MRIDIVSKEFPPSIYGGAGVHVAELTRVLASRADVRVHAFGEPRDPDYHGARVLTYPNPPGFDAALRARTPAFVSFVNPSVSSSVRSMYEAT